MKTIAGLAIGFMIGVGCRWFEIPVPGPTRILGALLVLSITVGYALADYQLRALSGHAGAPPASAGSPEEPR